MPTALPHKLLIGTFHKTGSVLMVRIWRDGCKKLGLRFWPIYPDRREEPPAWDVCFEDHSRFAPPLLTHPHRGLLVIRDPRDIIISGMHYHRRSEEEWLHRPRPSFGGLTYQQKINSLPTEEARLLFEMRHVGGRTLAEIEAARAAFPHFRVERFEDLVTDVDLKAYRALFTWAGFAGTALETLLQVAHDHSLFSGKVDNPGHIRSGRPEQWREGFSQRVMQMFVEAHGDLPERWGYASAAGVALPRRLPA
jgi:hypothetical protein